jgi:hypothetical protein
MSEYINEFDFQFDLSHTYHFDHPVDHIPGSYLVEALLSTVLKSSPEKQLPKQFKINFKEYALIDLPIIFKVKQNGELFEIEIFQKEKMIASAKISHFEIIPPSIPNNIDLTFITGMPKSSFLNKLKKQNIIISNLDQNEIASSIELESNHSLHKEELNHLYAFELSKQYLYLVGREKSQIANNSSMSVFGIEVFINRVMVPGKGFLINSKDKSMTEFNGKRFSKSIISINDLYGECALVVVEGVVMDKSNNVEKI